MSKPCATQYCKAIWSEAVRGGVGTGLCEVKLLTVVQGCFCLFAQAPLKGQIAFVVFFF